MPVTPTYQAAVAGQPALAGHINQFLGTHPTTYLYAGSSVSSQTTVGTGGVSTNGTYLAQSFTTGSNTAVGYVGVYIVDVGGSSGSVLSPGTISIYANSAGAPTGSPLVSATFTAEYVVWAPTYVIIPLPITGLTASTTYWIVINPQGNATYYYQWNKSNQTSGASTSTNGTTWTAQAYGFLYEVFNQGVTGTLTCAWADGGSRWTWSGYNSIGLPTQYAEYTAGQTSAGYIQSVRTLTYSNGRITGAA